MSHDNVYMLHGSYN